MKRYLSADMRSALKAIREEQGPDAVILSTRRTPEGVEVCAAIDVELASGQGALAETAALKQLERAVLEELEHGAVETIAAPPSASPASVTRATSLDNLDSLDSLDSVAGSAGSVGSASSVGEELRSLRALLEQQLAALAWNDFTRREPLKARALSELAKLGVERVLALQIVGDLPAGLSDEQMQRMPYAMLARRICIAPPPAERSGALALIGPPGSGKTTTLAKLAARYVLEQDAANLLILSTDDERLGSHEQLACLGRLLGVRVETVIGADRLAARIAALPGRCILIDTPGVVGRDGAAAAYYRALREQCAGLTMMLVLPASAQSGVVDDAVAHFGPEVSSCCALTRIDEAVSLGGVLSALARSQLPVAYACEGARIPEDLRPARAHQLVARAVELARLAQGCADDDLLARRYGGGVHAAA
ncbi:MAG TPA: flagellar biosynthesis protein FlhF [Steroidobacteraceae bacterium]|nr:flagellar biosynthesis protein FlhF [Steroidobacteraceae bacterium]